MNLALAVPTWVHTYIPLLAGAASFFTRRRVPLETTVPPVPDPVGAAPVTIYVKEVPLGIELTANVPFALALLVVNPTVPATVTYCPTAMPAVEVTFAVMVDVAMVEWEIFWFIAVHQED